MKKNQSCESKHPQTGTRCWSKQHADGRHWAVLPSKDGKIDRLYWTTQPTQPEVAAR